MAGKKDQKDVEPPSLQLKSWGDAMEESGAGLAVFSPSARASAEASKWHTQLDEKTGKYYYWNEETRETRWTKPKELEAVAELEKHEATTVKDEVGNTYSQNPAASVMSPLSPVSPVVQFTGSMTKLQTNWDSSDDEDEKDESGDSWEDDGDDGQDDEDTRTPHDIDPWGLGPQVMPEKTNVVEESDVDNSDDEEEKEQKDMLLRIEAKDDLIVKDEINTFKIVAQHHQDRYKMDEFGKNYFQPDKHKSGITRKIPTVAEMLTYQPYKKMTNAILKVDNDTNTMAKQTWKNINSYMGGRKTGKESILHVEKLLRYALKGPEQLRDEILLQLCKQTTKNPQILQLRQAWKLMVICLSVFPPSDEFSCYLSVFLYDKVQESGEVGKYAEFSLNALDRSMQSGQRRVPPTTDEIKRLEELDFLNIQVYLLDGTYRNFKVTSQTRAGQVLKAIETVFKMKHSDGFGLYEMEDPKPGWNRDVYTKRAKLTPQQKIDGLADMPWDRQLESNERVMDCVASWQRSKKKAAREIRFVYKCRLWSRVFEMTYSHYAWKVAYATAMWHVIHNIYLMPEPRAFRLAAVQMQAKYGVKDDSFWAPGVLAADAQQYVPWPLTKKYPTAEELEQIILENHPPYKELSRSDAYRKYIRYLRDKASPKYAGYCFFRCVRMTRVKTRPKDWRDDYVVGISEDGVVLCDPIDMQILEKYKMEEVLTYGFRNNAFLLVAGSLMTQKKIQFATMQGQEMHDLLRQHIAFRIEQARVQGIHLEVGAHLS